VLATARNVLFLLARVMFGCGVRSPLLYLAIASPATWLQSIRPMWWPGADQPAKPVSNATNRQDSRFGHMSVASVPEGRAAGMQRVNLPERSEGKNRPQPIRSHKSAGSRFGARSDPNEVRARAMDGPQSIHHRHADFQYSVMFVY